jgi:peptide/nickel transport system substrate-binding protein
MKKSRWILCTVVLVIIASLGLAACTPAAVETTTQPPVEEATQPAVQEATQAPTVEVAPTEVPTEAGPTVGGTLVWAFSAEPESLDPAKTGASVSDTVLGFIGCSLLSLDVDGNAVPYVASSWDVSTDGLTYTFHLRDDVKFANGKPVTAQDFAFEYLRALDPDTASPAAGPGLGDIQSITAIDDLTLEIVLGSPMFSFLFSIADPGYMQPVNQEDFETLGADAFARAPIGCGPYKLAEWETGSKITLERNPDYNWGPADAVENAGAYYIDQIEFRIIPEVATIAAGLEAGEIDVANITQTDKEYLSTLDVVKIEGYQQAGLRPYVAINVSHPPFDDINVRKAFNLAIDRQAALQVLAQGDGTIQYGPLSPAQIGYWSGVEQIGYGFDPDQAAGLMEQSGYAKDADGFWAKDGQRLSLTLYTLPIETWVKAAELVQQQFKEFGLDITLVQQDQGVLLPIVLGLEYDITMFGMTSPEADILWAMFQSSQIGGFNYAGVNDPELDAILDRTRTETDPAARQEAVDEAQKRIVEQAYTIPLYVPINYIAINSKIAGYRFSNIRFLDLDSAYFLP